ncbi:MAG: hypothetical protein ACFE8L_03360 [Candidatus Hodarchaeota archaeon]
MSTVTILALNMNIDFILNKNNENSGGHSDEFSIYTNQPDTTGPNITFIQPNVNWTDIESKSYEIIVNITDEHPPLPLPGYVLVQISNLTDLLINTSMISAGGDTWTYKWENLSTYQNKMFYIIRVWAKDSSVNESSTLSDAWYVYLNIPRKIDLSTLRLVIYIVGSSVIFASIIVFFNWLANRKLPYRRKKKESI